MVTHRTAPLAAADAVLRLDAGRVVEAVAPV
jgi:ABC-type transport system involved in cytochrome bd biosynthesis fused ATPase/permease subunit